MFRRLFIAVAAYGLGLTAPMAQDTLSGTIQANRTLTPGTNWILSGYVLIDSGYTLTVQPGTTVRGQKSTKGTLAIHSGARLVAAGTAQNPITFTSDEPDSAKTRGSWGGIVLLGRAVTNKGADNFEANTTWNYGGSNAAHDGGVLTYVRIDHPGFPVAPDKELNGLTMAGVGSGTTIHHVQVHNGDDDGFEWFGGSVNADHLIVTNQVDDGFDSDNGFSGTVSFIADIQGADANRTRCYPRTGLPDTCFAPEVVGDKCFESSSTKLAGGASVLPQTRPTWSHVTCVDNGRSGGAINLNEHAVGTFDRVLLVGDSSSYAIRLQSAGTNGGLLSGTPTLVFNRSATGGRWAGSRFSTDDTLNSSIIISGLTALLPNYSLPLYKDLGLANDTINDSIGAFIGDVPANYWYQGWTLPGTVSWARGLDRPTAIRPSAKQIGSISNVFSTRTAGGVLVIHSSFAVKASLEILDLNGRVLYRVKNLQLAKGDNRINGLASAKLAGAYFVNLRSGNNLHTEGMEKEVR